MAQLTLDIVVRIDDRPVELRPAGEWARDEDLATSDGDRFIVERPDQPLELAFEGGGVTINSADIGRWDFAHVLAIRVRRQADGRYRFDATVRHRDEGWEHYADRWQVLGDGVVNGERILLHPHDSEQPFTRSQSDVTADGVVTVAASDLVHGFGGSTIAIDLAAFDGERTIELLLETRE